MGVFVPNFSGHQTMSLLTLQMANLFSVPRNRMNFSKDLKYHSGQLNIVIPVELGVIL